MTTVSNVSQIVRDVGEHLDLAERLCVAVQNGIAAMACNRLKEFCQQLQLQEDLCSQLQAVMKRREQAATGNAQLEASTNLKELESATHGAHRRMRALNRRYAALVKRSNRSVGMLSSLCQTYIDDFGGADADRIRHQQWPARTR